ncbi:MAG: hypothetical protein NUW06_07075 [Candidatus Acetothermia bacterium]|jgi:hypothetical protein|nr:hypothetical protein [Candidatus Acetothermia bacterium]MDH7505479.1 hypothetical protein [Candidatus Acetothermia bacterium]
MAKESPGCSCGDPWGYLPPELRPKQKKASSLREARCPGCGKLFWTNRETDYCFDCEKRQGG